ncbi:MAG: delta-60 repeat domain-containing protein, partial [Flavobacteriales bacterium]|nr:delta-60 repeat domain-containing protein [Flavobacteriales bacterium]
IARINMDGTLDTSFDPGTGPNFGVYTIVLRPDGKILVGGAFSLWAGTPRNGIAQLNDDGSLDTAFDYDDGTGTAQYSYSIALQPDGKLIIAGLRDIGSPCNPISVG